MNRRILPILVVAIGACSGAQSTDEAQPEQTPTSNSDREDESPGTGDLAANESEVTVLVNGVRTLQASTTNSLRTVLAGFAELEIQSPSAQDVHRECVAAYVALAEAADQTSDDQSRTEQLVRACSRRINELWMAEALEQSELESQGE